MSEPSTCGKGLAEHSVLPARFGDLLAAMADNLEVHLDALDPEDMTNRAERDAYVKVARESRKIADELHALAAEMFGYRDLPMGRHRAEVLSSRRVVDAFAKLVSVEQALLSILEKAVEKHEEMLAGARRRKNT